MEIEDLSWNENISKRFNHPLLPRSIRGILVGKSGCGKTTLLLNLLLRCGWLDYDNLFVFGKSLFQPEYRILKKAFEKELPKEYILRLFNMREEIQSSQIPPVDVYWGFWYKLFTPFFLIFPNFSKPGPLFKFS